MLISLLAACGGSSSGNGDAVPEGNWAMVLAFDPAGACTGLPATADISFDLTQDADGSFTFNAGTGLGNDDLTGSSITCGGTTCTLHLEDTGPGDEEAGIDTQTIVADFTLQNDDSVDGNGTLNLTFTDPNTADCENDFTATGDVQ